MTALHLKLLFLMRPLAETLFSMCDSIDVTCITQKEKMMLRYFDSQGRKRVSGGAGLKGTQLYTPEFGRGLAAWWVAHAPSASGIAY